MNAYDRAREGSPFSNSTMWEIWSANWCCRCREDGMGIGKDEPQCELITVALCGRTPLEWLTASPEGDVFGDYHCIMFRDRDNPGGEEPKPIPDPPGQGALFDRKPFTGVRMPAGSEPREQVHA
jgi:hypothetical protein